MKHSLINVLKNTGKAGIKISISGVALYFVLRKTDIRSLYAIVQHISWFYLIPGFLLYNLAQVASAFRLSGFLKVTGIVTSFFYNLKLYYKGMFYNLFLPGGIGGDGVKGYILNKHSGKPLKQIIGALFLDRLSGFAGLLLLCFTFLLLSKVSPGLSEKKILIAGALILMYPVYYLFVRIFFRNYTKAFFKTSLLGINVNLVQTASVFFLLYSLGIKDHFIEYMAVFYVADIALLFPFTIGGAGARELVFLFAPKILPVDAHVGVTFSLLLFAITILSSVAGAFLKTEKYTIMNENEPA